MEKTQEQLEQEQKEQEQSQKEQELLMEIENLRKQVTTQETNKQSEIEQQKEQELIKLQQEADIKKAFSENKEIDLDELTNKEILDIVADAFDKSIEARTKIAIEAASKGNKGIEDKLTRLEQYLLKKEAKDGIDGARRKFRDFDDYKDDIAKVFEIYPGILPEDAYIIAKGRKSANVPPQKEVESEKPMSLGTRADNAQKRFDERMKKDDSVKLNKRQFRQMLMESAEKVIGSREE